MLTTSTPSKLGTAFIVINSVPSISVEVNSAFTLAVDSALSVANAGVAELMLENKIAKASNKLVVLLTRLFFLISTMKSFIFNSSSFFEYCPSVVLIYHKNVTSALHRSINLPPFNIFVTLYIN